MSAARSHARVLPPCCAAFGESPPGSAKLSQSRNEGVAAPREAPALRRAGLPGVGFGWSLGVTLPQEPHTVASVSPRFVHLLGLGQLSSATGGEVAPAPQPLRCCGRSKGVCTLLCSPGAFCTSAPWVARCPQSVFTDIPASFYQPPGPHSSGELRRTGQILAPYPPCVPQHPSSPPHCISQYFLDTLSYFQGKAAPSSRDLFSMGHFHMHEPGEEHTGLNAEAGRGHGDGRT